MNAKNSAIAMFALLGALSGCVASTGGGAGPRWERTETVPADKMYGQSFVAERKVLYGVKFEVQGGTADVYLLRVNDFSSNPKTTDNFMANALAKDMNTAAGGVVAELEPGSYMVLFDNPRTENIQVSWSKSVTAVGN